MVYVLRSFWPLAVMVLIALAISAFNPPRSTVDFTNWQTYLAIAISGLCSFLYLGNMENKMREFALFMGGFLVGRLLFW